MHMRGARLLLFVSLTVACGTEPTPVGAIVYGRILTTSGMAVPGATAIVEVYSDTISNPPYPPDCTGDTLLASVSQDMDAEGDYRLEISGTAPVGTRACLMVTGDTHGIYSDVGTRRAYAGWVELRPLNGPTPRDSLRFDFRYWETP